MRLKPISQKVCPMSPSTCITKTEKLALLQHTREVHEGLEKLICNLTPAQWTRRRTPHEWSPAEIVEHTLLAEDGILDGVTRHLHDQPSDLWQEQTGRKDLIIRRYLPNLGKAQANLRTSTFSGLDQRDVQDALFARLQSLGELLEIGCELPLKAVVWDNERFGSLNAYQWLLYLPLHSERHLNQLLRFTSDRAED